METYTTVLLLVGVMGGWCVLCGGWSAGFSAGFHRITRPHRLEGDRGLPGDTKSPGFFLRKFEFRKIAVCLERSSNIFLIDI